MTLLLFNVCNALGLAGLGSRAGWMICLCRMGIQAGKTAAFLKPMYRRIVDGYGEALSQSKKPEADNGWRKEGPPGRKSQRP